MNAVLELTGVGKAFGGVQAVRDMTFSLQEGELAGLIGPNGAGKTTLFNCVAGLYRPSDGSITFDGRDITRLPSYRVARLGLARTFQVVRPLKEMTVLENILVGAYLRHPQPEKALETAQRCLEICFLQEWRDRPAGDMTIGNKKRLEVARALATSPTLLLLDEAVAGLTSTEVKEMVEVILRLKAEGITILMVEHIMEAIMPISDKIVVLRSGVKIAEDTPRAVVQDPEVIKAYLGEKFSRRLAEKREAGGHE